MIQIGPDPLFADLPMRSFPASLAIAADVPAALDALGAALAARGLDQAKAAARRRERITERNADRQEALHAAIEAGRGAPMSPAWISHCLDRVKDDGCGAVQRAGLRSGRHDLHAAGLLFQPFAGRRPRLGPAGGARRQARRCAIAS